MSEVNIEKKAVISGYIKNSVGNPLAGVKVFCNAMNTLTLFNGFYQFMLEPGEYTIRAELTGFVNSNTEIIVEEGKENNLDFVLEEDVGKSKILGYVFDADTDEYIKDGIILLIKPNINKSYQIDPKNGYFEINKLKKGTYDIWISVIGYEEKKHIISVNEAEEKRQDFLIRRKEDEEVPWG